MLARRRALAAFATAAAFAVGLAIGLIAPSTPAPRRTAAVGPTRTVNGVPVGYARNAAGAVRAAAEYVRATGNPAWFNAQRRRAGLAEMATAAEAGRLDSAYRRQLQAQGTTSLGLALAAGERVVNVNVPLGYALGAYTRVQARVSVWLLNLAGSGFSKPEEHYQTLVMTLRWLRGDWRLDATSGRPGPIPRGAGVYNTAKSFMAAMEPIRWFDVPAP